MVREELQTAVESALLSQDAHNFAQLARNTPTTDLAEALQPMVPQEVARVLRLLPIGQRAGLFSFLPTTQQDAVLDVLPRHEQIELWEQLPSDDRADLYNRMEEDRRALIMPALAQLEREDILKLASYAEGTVGSITTSDYATVRANVSVGQALRTLREEAPDKETIYQVFIVDEQRRLKGTVSLRDLVIAPQGMLVVDLMRTDVVSVDAHEDREEAAKLIARYDLLVVPVVDGDERLIGIVTVDDAMDVAEEESTEDFHKGGANLALGETSVREASTWTLYRKRIVWLIILVFGNLFSSAGIAHFEDTIAAYVALVFFLPLLIGSGGNAGAQASTLMVRALATGDVQLTDWLRMLGREVGVAALLGVTMALAIVGVGWFHGGPQIAQVVAYSMVAIVVVGSLVGMSLPFLLSHLRLDPATASAPLVTTIADAIGVIIYLSLAVVLLGAPV